LGDLNPWTCVRRGHVAFSSVVDREYGSPSAQPLPRRPQHEHEPNDRRHHSRVAGGFTVRKAELWPGQDVRASLGYDRNRLAHLAHVGDPHFRGCSQHGTSHRSDHIQTAANWGYASEGRRPLLPNSPRRRSPVPSSRGWPSWPRLLRPPATELPSGNAAHPAGISSAAETVNNVSSCPHPWDQGPAGTRKGRQPRVSNQHYVSYAPDHSACNGNRSS
jgi:hypothetical protein